MMTAEEARRELEKKPIDRVPKNVQEILQMALEMFEQDLEELATRKIREAVLLNKTSTFVHVSLGLTTLYNSGCAHPDIKTMEKYELFRVLYGEMLGKGLGIPVPVWTVYRDSFIKATNEYSDKLEELGYSTSVENSQGRMEKVGNRITLHISWESENNYDKDRDKVDLNDYPTKKTKKWWELR